MTASVTAAEIRALRDVEKRTRFSSGYPRHGRLSVESRHPIAAASCARKGLMTRFEQSELCRPNRRRYFSTYMLTADGIRALG